MLDTRYATKGLLDRQFLHAYKLSVPNICLDDFRRKEMNDAEAGV